MKRGSHDYQAMDYMVKLLSRYLVLIHPEGTRNPTRVLQPGKVGVGKVIHEAQCKVVPVYFEGMDHFLPKGRMFPCFFQKLKIIFGDPVRLDDLLVLENSRETSRLIIDRVMESIAAEQQKFFARFD